MKKSCCHQLVTVVIRPSLCLRQHFFFLPSTGRRCPVAAALLSPSVAPLISIECIQPPLSAFLWFPLSLFFAFSLVRRGPLLLRTPLIFNSGGDDDGDDVNDDQGERQRALRAGCGLLYRSCLCVARACISLSCGRCRVAGSAFKLPTNAKNKTELLCVAFRNNFRTEPFGRSNVLE